MPLLGRRILPAALLRRVVKVIDWPGHHRALFLLLSATSVGISQQSSVPSPAASTQSPHSTEQGHPALSNVRRQIRRRARSSLMSW